MSELNYAGQRRLVLEHSPDQASVGDEGVGRRQRTIRHHSLSICELKYRDRRSTGKAISADIFLLGTYTKYM
eukprot:6195974-Pleurochrysis_carterae.AAC.1